MNEYVTVLYASQMGAAKELAGRAADDLTEAGIEAYDFDMGEYSTEKLKNDQRVLVIASTWGDGEPPDDCEEFFEAFTDAEGLDLSHITFAVMALGDSSYEHFCKHGKDLDETFEKHGASRLKERVDCDLDEQEKYPDWIREVAVLLGSRSQCEAV
ncbi:MAG: flavodoxin domain-containing protein [Verrucomicrobiota bacterium]